MVRWRTRCDSALRDAVADVVDTGGTLRQAGLEVIGSPLRSGSPGPPLHNDASSAGGRSSGACRCHRRAGLRDGGLRHRGAIARCGFGHHPGLESPTVAAPKEAGWVGCARWWRRTRAHLVMDRLFGTSAAGPSSSRTSTPAAYDHAVRGRWTRPGPGFCRAHRYPAVVRPTGDYAESLRRATSRSGLMGWKPGRRGRGEWPSRGRHRGEFGFLAGLWASAGRRQAVAAYRRATAERLVITLPTSGGTRMQEGTAAFFRMTDIARAAHEHLASGRYGSGGCATRRPAGGWPRGSYADITAEGSQGRC